MSISASSCSLKGPLTAEAEYILSVSVLHKQKLKHLSSYLQCFLLIMTVLPQIQWISDGTQLMVLKKRQNDAFKNSAVNVSLSP